MENIENTVINETPATKCPRVYSDEITERLRAEIGDFKEVANLGTRARQVGTDYKDYLYVLDGKWLVTVGANHFDHQDGLYDSLTIQNYQEVQMQRRLFGRRAAYLSKQARVPWNVGAMVAHLTDDAEAIHTLEAIRAKRGTPDEAQAWELSCGIGRRTRAMQEILGEEIWSKLDCNGQKRTMILADYLLGE